MALDLPDNVDALVVEIPATDMVLLDTDGWSKKLRNVGTRRNPPVIRNVTTNALHTMSSAYIFSYGQALETWGIETT